MTSPEPTGGGGGGVRAALVRWRAPLVLVPLVAGLIGAGYVGADMLWGDEPSAAAPAPVVTCWDGTEAPSDTCTAPSGVAGLRWVFPSFEPGDARCSRLTRRGDPETLPLEFSCRTRVEGTTAEVNYSERSDLGRGLAYFENRFAGVDPEPAGGGTRLVYRGTTPRRDGTYEVTVAYTDLPFAVTVSAVNERLRDAVLERVELRPDRFVRVRPPGAPAR